jgi:hypothetical protein
MMMHGLTYFKVCYEFDWISSEIHVTVLRDADFFFEFDKIKFLEVMNGVYG